MARSIKLTRYQVEPVENADLQAFRLRVVAEDASNTNQDVNVFLYLRKPLNPYTNRRDDVFYAVASPADMADYPVGAPDPDQAYPFFRLPYVELDLRSQSLVEDVWKIIQEEVGNLLTALERMDQLSQVQEIFLEPDQESTGMPLRLIRGDTWKRTWIIKDQAGPINLTGATARLQLRTMDDTLVAEASTANGRITITPLEGRIDMTMPAGVMASLDVGLYKFDLEVTYPDNTVSTYEQGTVNLIPDVTR